MARTTSTLPSLRQLTDFSLSAPLNSVETAHEIFTSVLASRQASDAGTQGSLIAPPVGGLGTNGSPIDPASVPAPARRGRPKRVGLPVESAPAPSTNPLPDQGTPGEDDEITDTSDT